MHVEHITNLCTVEEIEEAINNLSGELHKTYRTIILDILTKYPGAKNHALLKRMFIWLCQANYCLPLPEFVALVTMNAKDGFVNRKAIPMRPEAFCRRLGPLLNLDRHVYPPEVNLSHATMEQYLQSDALRDDPSLGELHVSPLDAQKFLAEACLRFLQMDDFRTPLSDERTGRENPFKGLYGGLGIGAENRKYDWDVKMKERMRLSTGQNTFIGPDTPSKSSASASCPSLTTGSELGISGIGAGKKLTHISASSRNASATNGRNQKSSSRPSSSLSSTDVRSRGGQRMTTTNLQPKMCPTPTRAWSHRGVVN